MTNEIKLEKKRPETYEIWSSRVLRALKWRQTHPNGDKRWIANIKLAWGQHWNLRDREADELSSDDPSDRVRVQMIGSLVQDFRAFLLRHNPRFIGRPRRGSDDGPAARRKAALLNYAWTEYGIQKQIRRAVQDGIIVGHGIVKIGWTMELNPAVTPDKDGLVEYHSAVQKDAPFARRINPRRFIIDPEAPDFDLDSARWVAEVFYRPLQDVVRDKRYRASLRKKIQSGSVAVTRMDSFVRAQQADASQIRLPLDEDEIEATAPLVLYEVWDKKFKRRYVLADGVDDEALLDEAWPYEYLDGFPYEMWHFIEQNDDFYGQGLPEFVEDQQHELNRVRSSQFKHRRTFATRRYQALENGIVPGELNKLKSDADGEVVIVKTPGAIQVIENPTLPTDHDRVENAIKEDFRSLLGADQLLQGGSLPSRTSATEVKTRAALIGLKIEDKVSAVDDFVLRVGRQIAQHYSVQFREAQAVYVIGPEGAGWQTMSVEDARAEVDFELVTVSAERTDPMLERQQAVQVLDILVRNGPLIAQQGWMVNLPRLILWLLLEKFDVKEASDFLVQLPGGGMPVQPGMPGAGAPGENVPADGMPMADRSMQASAAPVESGLFGSLLGSLNGGGQ